jgi:hypothetical protein
VTGRFLLVADDFYPDPDGVRRRALRMTYRAAKGFAGLRTRPHQERGIKARLERVLGRRIATWSSDLDDIGLGNGSFFKAFARGPEADPAGIHFDTPAGYLTAVVYLNQSPPKDSGTSFFRHKRTGLEAAPTAADVRALSATRQELAQRLERDGLDRRRWKEIERVENRYNRCVVFRSGMLHSATRHFGASLRDGRIYQAFRFGV